jgi:hypothetical protein
VCVRRRARISITKEGISDFGVSVSAHLLLLREMR